MSRSTLSRPFAAALASGAGALLILSLHPPLQGQGSCFSQVGLCSATSPGASGAGADLPDRDDGTNPGDMPAVLGRGKFFWEIGEIERARLEFVRATRLKRLEAELKVEEL